MISACPKQQRAGSKHKQRSAESFSQYDVGCDVSGKIVTAPPDLGQQRHRHRERSPCFPLFPHHASRIELYWDTLALVQTFSQLIERWLLGDSFDFCQQIIRQGHSSHSSPGLQDAMQSIRHISQLNHLRHAANVLSCFPPVNLAGLGADDLSIAG